MKVILNQDVKTLGEEGDVKNVANGYARNYLFPRNFAVPYTPFTVKYFESKKSEIEERKNTKRSDAAGLKEKLEAFTVEITMSSGPTGKLYGAVTAQTVADELNKNGFAIERKRIEIPGLTIKHTGKYFAVIHLYESSSASVQVIVSGQEEVEAKKRKAAEEARAAKRAAAVKTETVDAAEKPSVSDDSSDTGESEIAQPSGDAAPLGETAAYETPAV